MTGRVQARFWGRVVALLGVALLVGLLGRSSGESGGGGTEAAVPDFSVEPGPSGQPVAPSGPVPVTTAEERFDLFSFRGICQGEAPRPVPRAARVSASGLHPLVVHVNGLLHQFAGSGGRDRVDPFTPLPEQVQLVACAEYQGRGKLLKECRYTAPDAAPRTITHYEGRYRMRVYEALTGRLIGTQGMAGQTSVSCTPFVKEGADSVVTEAPDDAALRAVLGPYARGARP